MKNKLVSDSSDGEDSDKVKGANSKATHDSSGEDTAKGKSEGKKKVNKERDHQGNEVVYLF